jgi:hypothetical protein
MHNHRVSIRNFGGELSVASARQNARDARSVQRAVRWASDQGLRVRPLGTRYSISDVSVGDGLLLDLRRLVAPPEMIPNVDGRPLVRVFAGTTIGEVHAFLAARGLSVATAPYFTGVTWVGACATGSHGSAIHQPPLSAFIRAFELIDGRGRHVWIEHESDRGVCPEGKTPIEVDDALFDSLGVHLGAFGVIISVIVEPAPVHWVLERRVKMDFSSVLARLADEHERAFAASCFVSPYARRGRRPAVVTFHTRSPSRSPFAQSGGDSPPRMVRMYARMLRAMGEFRLFPTRIPELLESALDVFAPARTLDAPSYALLGTDYLGFPPRGIATEWAIPYERNSASSLAAAFGVIEELFEHIEVARARGRFVGGYASIRFARRWDSPLSATQGSDAVFVELLNVNGTPRQRDVLRDLEDALRPRLLRRHFALLHHHVPGEMAKLYPELDRWMLARHRADPHQVFASAYTDRNGLCTEPDRARVRTRA